MMGTSVEVRLTVMTMSTRTKLTMMRVQMLMLLMALKVKPVMLRMIRMMMATVGMIRARIKMMVVMITNMTWIMMRTMTATHVEVTTLMITAKPSSFCHLPSTPVQCP